MVTDTPFEIVQAMRDAAARDQEDLKREAAARDQESSKREPPQSQSDYRAGDESVDPNAPTIARQSPEQARAWLAAFANGGFPAPPPTGGFDVQEDDPTLASAASQAGLDAVPRHVQHAPPPSFAQVPIQAPHAAPPASFARPPTHEHGQPTPMHGQPSQPLQPAPHHSGWARVPFPQPPPAVNNARRMLVLFLVALGTAFVFFSLLAAGAFLFYQSRVRHLGP